MYQLNQIPSGSQIKKYIRRIIFGKNVFCPRCRSRSVLRYEDRYRCKKCRLKFSLLSHTWLKDMKVSLQKFWVLLWCWTQKVSVQQAMALSRCSEKAVRHWYDLFRIHLPEEYHVLERIVQLDEAYFGGRNGYSLLMGKQPRTRKLACIFINGSSVQRHHAVEFLKQHVKPRSRLYTDGAMIYKGINRWWPVQQKRDIHRKFEFTHTSEIEGIFGNLRTFIRRMYHHVTLEKLPEYVSEFCFRFSSPEMFENPLNYLQKSLYLVPTG